ncbi:hypothetical protein C7T94_16145 [Pedobacter yulinensis]|uniref:Helix-hairpin-helix domain-containing protein n=1 Tax=Pedobacter yulinensis TaxID=2126353 RepID=A0A2T3HIP4_9SPHI|nr:helix-hairpin-helix domain-containing protein [Pedobacter yulinensis]PST82314.1 hypothetical protein C7T94_16145 [Pedobacter yulinensis]
MIRKWLGLHFGMSRREYNGLVVLAVLITLVRLCSAAWSWWQSGKATGPTITELAAVRELQALPEARPFALKPREKRSLRRTQRFFRFDPNKANQADWQELGLSEKQAAAILRYREKGGVFRRKADVARMYTIRPELYQKLEPYIDIQEVTANEPRFNAEKVSQIIIVPLHEADSAGLTSVRGLGPAFASRIVRYRDRLGGFYSLHQLAEVYGMDSLRLQQILPQLRLDPSKIRRIPVNQVTFDQLKGHPYLRYKQVSALIAYRDQHGPYKSTADLKKVVILPPETIRKLEPYLIFE